MSNASDSKQETARLVTITDIETVGAGLGGGTKPPSVYYTIRFKDGTTHMSKDAGSIILLFFPTIRLNKSGTAYEIVSKDDTNIIQLIPGSITEQMFRLDLYKQQKK